MRSNATLLAAIAYRPPWIVALVALLVIAVSVDLLVPPRLLSQQSLPDYQQSEDDDSEPSESPTDDDAAGLCETPQSRIRRQATVSWRADAGRQAGPRNSLSSRHLSPADLSSRNGIGVPLRC
jgi:hypothetical protein